MDCTRVAQDNVAERYLLGQLDDAEREAFERHYFECDACFAELEVLKAAQDLLEREGVSGADELRTPSLFKTWGWAVAAAAVVVVGIVLLLWLVVLPPLPQAPVRVDVLAELARIEPPAYSPMVLRGAADEAQQRFRTAMESYSGGDYASAIPGLEEAAELDPNAANISFFLGASYLLTDRTSEGIATLERTVDLGDTPYLEEALLLLARAHLGTGDIRTARNELRRVLELDGDLVEQARTLLEKLPGGTTTTD
jgi:tetratricopeptide (TPR) repeat protein